MDGFDRLYELHTLLRNRRYPISSRELMGELECSRSTLQRHLQHLRDYLGAPIRTVRGRGYQYDEEQVFELPGLWFNADELQALLAAQQMLEGVEPGIFKEHVAPLRRRLETLLEKAAPKTASRELGKRLKLQPAFRRHFSGSHHVFAVVAAATMQRRRLHIHYHGRASNIPGERCVSPQRLLHYRDNWYLDAWCHQRDGLRRFALDRIEKAKKCGEPAQEVPAEQLQTYFEGYGVFGGQSRQTAVLRFSAERARWVADETWHPDQQSRWLESGEYELTVPYTDPRELIGDVLRHGKHVEVVESDTLRQAVAEEIRHMLGKYS